MKYPTFSFLLIFSLLSCDLEDSAEELDSSCLSEFEALKTSNDISEECKQEIEGLLPEPENNFTQGIFRTGINVSSTSIGLFFTTSEEGDSPNVQELTVTEYVDGIPTSLTTQDIGLAVSDVLSLSISSVLDYSGSMSSENIKEAIDIYDDFISVVQLTNLVEANHYIFSEEPLQILSYSEDISGSLSFQDQVERRSTALLDGIGVGIESLVGRQRPLKLIVVTTDGLENSSTQFSEDQLIELANNNNVTLIIVGSLFSDISLFRRLTSATNGFFVYQRTISKIRSEMSEIANFISNQTYQLTVPNNNADSIQVTYQNTTIQYAL